MVINLIDLLDGNSEKFDFTGVITVSNQYGLSDLNVSVHVFGDVLKTGDDYYIDGRLTSKLDFKCSSCLSPTVFQMDIPIREKFFLLKEGVEITEDIYYVSYNKINLETVLTENMLINIPIKVLCNDNCKGLCCLCGQNLNEGTCACKDNVYDPRFEVLRSLFNDKEV